MDTANNGMNGFAVPELPFGPIPEGTSLLVTGDDTAAVEAVFYHLVTARETERSLVLATDRNGRTVNRELDRVEYGASNRSTVLTCNGPDPGCNISTVDDLVDLTGVGIQFSALVTESGAMATPQRAGILLCSRIFNEVDDVNSVSRFLRGYFLTQLRQNGIFGVCALNTVPEIGDITGIIESIGLSFTAHIRVETTDTNQLELHLVGSDKNEDHLTVTLPEYTHLGKA